MAKKIEGSFEVLKLRRTQDLSSRGNTKKIPRKVKVKNKGKMSHSIRMQLLKNYGFFVEEN